MHPHLRVYPESLDYASSETSPATVRVSLGALLPLLTLAHRHNYLWLQDFLDDEVCVLCPFWSGTPYEMLIIPRQHGPHLYRAEASDRAARPWIYEVPRERPA